MTPCTICLEEHFLPSGPICLSCSQKTKHKNDLIKLREQVVSDLKKKEAEEITIDMF